VGVWTLLFGIDAAATASASPTLSIACIVVGAMALALYVPHARRSEHPIVDLGLLSASTFRTSVTGGSLFRIGAGAMPFLLPLLFQVGFGYSPFESGLITAVSAIGSMGIRSLSSHVLRRFGFRDVLLRNAFVAALSIALCAFIQPGLPHAVILGILFFGGVSRSPEFITLNTLAFADLEHGQMSHATSFSTMAQRLSQTMGVALGAFALHVAPGVGHGIHAEAFPVAFTIIALVSLSSVPAFVRLHPDAGAELAGRSPGSSGA
jgi:hypothetical protein